MYVPGLLKDTDTFICDIGTGYYVEKVILSEILIYHKIKNMYTCTWGRSIEIHVHTWNEDFWSLG